MRRHGSFLLVFGLIVAAVGVVAIMWRSLGVAGMSHDLSLRVMTEHPELSTAQSDALRGVLAVVIATGDVFVWTLAGVLIAPGLVMALIGRRVCRLENSLR
jgi:hypothetical protein